MLSNHALFSKSMIPYWTSFFSGFLCCIPLLVMLPFNYGDHTEENAPLSIALQSTDFAFLLLAAVSVCCPFILEFIFDAFSSSKDDRQVYISRHWILALLLPTILMYLARALHRPDALVIICHCQNIFYFHNFVFYMNQMAPNIWTNFCTVASATMFSIFQIYFCFVPFMTIRYPAVEAFMAVLALLSQLSVGVRTLRWLQYLYTEWKRRKAYESSLSASRRGDLSIRDYCCSLYLSANLVGILGGWILYALFCNDNWADNQLEYLGGMIFLYTLLTVIATVAHMRVTRKQMMFTQVTNHHMFVCLLTA